MDLTARMILGRATMRHLRAMVTYFSTKSAMPTIHSRSKKSSVSRLGFRNMRLRGGGGGRFRESGYSLKVPGPWWLLLLALGALLSITCRQRTDLGIGHLCSVSESATNLLCDLWWMS